LPKLVCSELRSNVADSDGFERVDVRGPSRVEEVLKEVGGEAEMVAVGGAGGEGVEGKTLESAAEWEEAEDGRRSDVVAEIEAFEDVVRGEESLVEEDRVLVGMSIWVGRNAVLGGGGVDDDPQALHGRGRCSKCLSYSVVSKVEGRQPKERGRGRKENDDALFHPDVLFDVHVKRFELGTLAE
jgi:hypothetical protein